MKQKSSMVFASIVFNYLEDKTTSVQAKPKVWVQ